MEVEDIQMQIQGYLCQLGLKDLQGIAKTLGCSEGETKDKNRRKLVSLIEERLEEALKTKADKIEYLEEFKSQLMEYTPVCPPLESTPGNVQSPSKEGKPYVEDKSKVEEKPKVEDLKPKVEDVKPLYFQPSDFKREFKIIGQIGEPGQKDKLSFVSLARQIEGALQKGYKPSEVVDAVVRAINPGMRLRSYLEGLEGLTLPRLRSILRSHYQEKSATELYRQLSTLAQEPQEGPQSFLIRALDTRQKILFATKEADTQLKYDPALVQGMFLHALDTGLQDETIRTRMRPLLQTVGVQDEDLIQRMNETVLEETERKSKLGSSTRHKNPKVNEMHTLQTGGGSAQQGQTDKMKSPGRENFTEEKVMAALQEVRSQLATLKESVEKDRADRDRLTKTPPESQDYQRYQTHMGCPSCQSKGRGELCDHCHVCGSSEHWARGCRKKNSSGDKAGSGNRRGLRPRDRK